MTTRPISSKQEFNRRLRKARRELYKTVVRTDEELATLERHQPGAFAEDASEAGVATLLSRLEGRERHLLDEIAAAQARLAAGTYGVCEGCEKPIPLVRLRALPATRYCIACELAVERAAGRA